MRNTLSWLLSIILLGWAATGCASLPANTGRVASRAFDSPGTTSLGRLSEARRAQARARSDSAFALVDGVDLAYSSRLALIENAERSLDLQYYAIHADATTETLLQAIRDAARRGVRVRVLLDDFNSVGEDAQVLRLAFEPNVEMRLFNPLPGPRNNLIGHILGSLDDMERVQKRMHNKLLIADTAWSITGGRNIGDEYFGVAGKQNFVDLDVLATGRIVRDMAASFDRFWNDDLAYPVQRLISKKELEKLRDLSGGTKADPESSQAAAGARSVAATPADTARAKPTVLPTVTPEEAAAARRPPVDLRTVPLVWAPSAFMGDRPGKIGPDEDEANAGETVIDGLLSIMQGAQHDVLMVSPYFVPGPRMMAVYEQLRRRGVRIRVLTNSLASNDAVAAHAGYMRYRKALLDIGVELHEMRSDPSTAPELAGSSGHSGVSLGSAAGGSKALGKRRASLHTKAVVVDGRLTIVGSMNLDLRSQLQNSEEALVIRSAKLAAAATQQVEQTFATGAYRVERDGGDLVWRAPPGASFQDSRTDPEAGARRKLLVRLIAPFAPDEML
ncbi:MAG TPA: phospholipase D family protein [Ramlibacter sp.]|uniref:phospholipase D family protein n=1 Tax=Ramlibacter sp. TaxID=1917967 RepID=UPI002C7FC483|nr:phospholipase D family protein [Ramlibacter sp.]HVZ44119.1 phospholipase D family protein [Ramlibacter sp.]